MFMLAVVCSEHFVRMIFHVMVVVRALEHVLIEDKVSVTTRICVQLMSVGAWISA